MNTFQKNCLFYDYFYYICWVITLAEGFKGWKRAWQYTYLDVMLRFDIYASEFRNFKLFIIDKAMGILHNVYTLIHIVMCWIRIHPSMRIIMRYFWLSITFNKEWIPWA